MNTNNVSLKTWAPKIHQEAIAELIDEGHAMYEVDSDQQLVVENLWGAEDKDFFGAVRDECLVDLCMFGGWVVEGNKGEDFETPEVGKKALATWVRVAVGALKALAKAKGGGSNEEDAYDVLVSEVLDEGAELLDGKQTADLVGAMAECREAEVAWGEGVEVKLARLVVAASRSQGGGEGGDEGGEGGVRGSSFTAARRLLEGLGRGEGRLKSFKKQEQTGSEKEKETKGKELAEVIWPIVKSGADDFWAEENGADDRKAFAELCTSFVYFLEPDSEVESEKGEVAEEEEQEKKEEEEKEKKEGKKKMTTVKLTRVEIDFSDSDSESDDEAKLGGELGEDIDRAVAKEGKAMATDRLRRVNIEGSDEEDEEEEVIVEEVARVGGGEKGKGKGKEKKQMGEQAATFSAFLKVVLPLGGAPQMKNGVDKIQNEAEQDAAGTLDGALRLAAVLDPAAFAKRAREESEKVNCNLFNQLVDHGELIEMLSGGM